MSSALTTGDRICCTLSTSRPNVRGSWLCIAIFGGIFLCGVGKLSVGHTNRTISCESHASLLRVFVCDVRLQAEAHLHLMSYEHCRIHAIALTHHDRINDFVNHRLANWYLLVVTFDLPWIRSSLSSNNLRLPPI